MIYIWKNKIDKYIIIVSLRIYDALRLWKGIMLHVAAKNYNLFRLSDFFVWQNFHHWYQNQNWFCQSSLLYQNLIMSFDKIAILGWQTLPIVFNIKQRWIKTKFVTLFFFQLNILLIPSSQVRIPHYYPIFIYVRVMPHVMTAMPNKKLHEFLRRGPHTRIFK